MKRPRSIVVAGPGTNRDADVALALELAGSDPQILRIAQLAADPSALSAAGLIVIAGGFSYGDSLGAGRMLALDLELHLHDHLRAFVASQRAVLGICNGFQVLTRAGLLPGALGHNASGQFVCGWVSLEPERTSHSIWTAGLPGALDAPVAHGEGRYVHRDPLALERAGQIALRYGPATGIAIGNPNGSTADIAGVCDAAGTVLGLMPHPENNVLDRQHPRHRHAEVAATSGLALFRNGVDHARNG